MSRWLQTDTWVPKHELILRMAFKWSLLLAFIALEAIVVVAIGRWVIP